MGNSLRDGKAERQLTVAYTGRTGNLWLRFRATCRR
jgi:hypothetical protein